MDECGQARFAGAYSDIAGLLATLQVIHRAETDWPAPVLCARPLNLFEELVNRSVVYITPRADEGQRSDGIRAERLNLA